MAMGNWKIPLIVLLTLALLVLFACFPGIASAMQDWQNMHVPSFGDIRSVQLDIRSAVPPLGKLAMMYKQDGLIKVSEDMASLTVDEVVALAFDAIAPYVDAGMADPFDPTSAKVYSISPVLAQVPEMPELSGIFWDVIITADSTAFYEFGLAIDDETGKVLQIQFASNYAITEEEMPIFLDTFADIYFTGLEIENYEDFATTDLESAYVGDNGRAVRYRFGDLEYGEINVDLCIYSNGFYIAFPD